MPAQILRNQPLAWYHNSPRPSHSKLRDFDKRGARYYHDRYVAGTIARETTPALEFGEAFEALYQGGADLFAQTVAVAPFGGVDRRTNAGKAFVAASRGKIAIGHDDYLVMLEMAAACREQPLAEALTSEAEQQVTLVGDWHGLELQARPDWLSTEGCAASGFRPYTVDLKTTKDLTEIANGRALISYGYHTQAALVRQLARLNGLEEPVCYLLAVEKQVPYRAALLELAPDLLEWAEHWFASVCPRLAACLDAHEWPRAEPEVITIHRPRWARTEPDNDQT